MTTPFTLGRRSLHGVVNFRIRYSKQSMTLDRNKNTFENVKVITVQSNTCRKVPFVVQILIIATNGIIIIDEPHIHQPKLFAQSG